MAKSWHPVNRPRRWVIYKDLAEASYIPPGWHGWMHYTVDEPPVEDDYEPRSWEQEHRPNMTGLPGAYRPRGSVLASGADRKNAARVGYKPWIPE